VLKWENRGEEGKKGRWGTKPKEQVVGIKKREGMGQERTLRRPCMLQGLSLRIMSPKIPHSGTQRRIDRVFQVPL